MALKKANVLVVEVGADLPALRTRCRPETRVLVAATRPLEDVRRDLDAFFGNRYSAASLGMKFLP